MLLVKEMPIQRYLEWTVGIPWEQGYKFGNDSRQHSKFLQFKNNVVLSMHKDHHPTSNRKHIMHGFN